jgi:hypothetical protein
MDKESITGSTVRTGHGSRPRPPPPSRQDWSSKNIWEMSNIKYECRMNISKLRIWTAQSIKADILANRRVREGNDMDGIKNISYHALVLVAVTRLWTSRKETLILCMFQET